ncbi:hypothetical protein Y032_0558g3426 [Ancylostoma ceylanicum]|uniref:Uncharacterized protein n=1 Tax=Ancylostoma ceylanicum TaxID=53326 RepID=A0A016WQ05_9BILA|nr:hypothetical protein Y032_0558g3426 [Ancylostoma ceylanicum]
MKIVVLFLICLLYVITTQAAPRNARKACLYPPCDPLLRSARSVHPSDVGGWMGGPEMPPLMPVVYGTRDKRGVGEWWKTTTTKWPGKWWTNKREKRAWWKSTTTKRPGQWWN